MVAFGYLITLLVVSFTSTDAFTPSLPKHRATLTTVLYAESSTSASTGLRKAQELIKSLVEEKKCFSTEAGAKSFGDACAFNVVYEDCFQPQPVVGKTPVTEHLLQKVEARKGRGEVRLDMLSDGDEACGFAWTWTAGDEEGLRGTTYVGLNKQGLIEYVREIPEPIFKPGDLTLELLKAVTAGAEPNPPKEYDPRTPTTACDVVDYLFNTVQGSSIDESVRIFDDSIVYRDFNYENVLNGKTEVRKFIEDFSFPGIEFRAQRIDDGIESCCFTWEVALLDAPDTIKGISFYKLDPITRKVSYVRDVPESAIKPPLLGKLARDFRPGLGVFQGVKAGSRPGGM
eukprot:CAMPEP_0119006458 /NCGR_PEP_ID=MMETSP1176-20130426/2304_1 /TAXON_ID=265551 /ORGANISM="Synedropsis recta cf, Strain CCMP1620" /LENGTH=342 /DNA_ID=CAMNT_0006958371 /DNA_START=27 /DNA_END=1055 /DNA_ORIENTATION=+